MSDVINARQGYYGYWVQCLCPQGWGWGKVAPIYLAQPQVSPKVAPIYLAQSQVSPKVAPIYLPER